MSGLCTLVAWFVRCHAARFLSREFIALPVIMSAFPTCSLRCHPPFCLVMQKHAAHLFQLHAATLPPTCRTAIARCIPWGRGGNRQGLRKRGMGSQRAVWQETIGTVHRRTPACRIHTTWTNQTQCRSHVLLHRAGIEDDVLVSVPLELTTAANAATSENKEPVRWSFDDFCSTELVPFL